MPDFDIRKWLNTALAEDIVYNDKTKSSAIRAIVERDDGTQEAIPSVNNSPYLYPVRIEVSIDDVPSVVTGKVNGHTVTTKDIEGKPATYSVVKIIKYDEVSRSFKLGLS